MKKLLLSILTVLVCFSFALTVFAADDSEQSKETAVDASQPRLMVTEYKIDGSSVSPGKDTQIEITFKNFSSTKAVSNIKLSLIDESGEIKADGMGNTFVRKINADSSYTWQTSVTSSKLAQVGEHKLTVTAEYEDKYYNAYSATDILLVNVKQSVSLDYDGVKLPKKVIQDDTITMDVNLMNTGKSNIRNARLLFDIEGLESGGTLFIGEIAAGESSAGSANFRVSGEKLGDVKGKATLKYEDEFSKEYSKTINVSTKIDKKIEIEETVKEEEKKNPQWWVFVLIGTAAGGAVGFAVPTAIHSKKQRKEDEMRL